jgi:Vitamin K-dependent gamma-carboxylase
VTATAAAAPDRALSPLDAVDELLGRRVSMRSLALLRVLIGPVTLLHLRPFVVDALNGRIYRDTFYEPYASWYPDLPRPLYGAVLAVGIVAAVALSLGFCTRVAAGATFGVVTYNLFLSTTHVHSNRAYLVIVLAALTIAPCGRELSVDAWIRTRRRLPPLDPRAPGWPLWLLRFEAAAVYGASGMSKLVDPDWFGGTVTWHRIVQVRDRLDASPLPGWAVSVLADRSFHTVAAKVIVITELFIAIGLWWRATRYAAVWVAVCFHVAIEVSASVQVFSYLAIAALVIWAVPSARDRVVIMDPENPSHQRLAPLISTLDWLARFRVVDAAPGAPVTLMDRDGTASCGGPAVARVLSRLPLTAWFALPTLLLPPVRRARRPRVPDQADTGRPGRGGGHAREGERPDQSGLAASGPR